MSSSLVVINSGEDTFRPDFMHASLDGDAAFPIGTVGPNSVVEFPLDETLCKTDTSRSMLWGDARIEKLWSQTLSEQDSVACYMLYRDPATRRPLSVCAL